MTKSPQHEYIRRFRALTTGPELRVADNMTNRLGWEEPAPAESGGFAILHPWRTPPPGLPKFLREKTDWRGIQAPAAVIAHLSRTQRDNLCSLVVDGPTTTPPLLEGSYPALEALDLRIDVDIAEPFLRLWSLTLTMKDRPKLASRWIAGCRLEHAEAYYPAKIDWLAVIPPDDVKYVASNGAVGSPVAISRFVNATDVHIKQARTLKSLDVLQPMRDLRALSLYDLASLDDLDAILGAEKLAVVHFYSCKDKNGAIGAAVTALRARGVLVRCEFTKSNGEDLKVEDF